MALTTGKGGRAHVFEVSNRVAVQELNGTTIALLRSDLDGHTTVENSSAHVIGNVSGLQSALDEKSAVGHGHVINDISGLQTELDGKQDVFSGATGSFTYIKSVNFVAQTVVTGTINVSNGIITSIS